MDSFFQDWSPLALLGIFLLASYLMIWRLEVLADSGFEGTVLGTLIMPYCSGLGNLVFVFLMVRQPEGGGEVAVNCLVNNVTNLTLLIGLPMLLWSQSFGERSRKKKRKQERTALQVTRLQLLLTMLAALFFTGMVWALSQDGILSLYDGMVLVGTFLFWQCFNVYDVLKTNLQKSRRIEASLLFEVLLLLCAAAGIFVSIDGLVDWLQEQKSGFLQREYLGWLTGWLMVLPNGLLAIYYGWKLRMDVVYSSQIGDGHICIPLCLGLYALAHPLPVPPVCQQGLLLLAAAYLAHFILAGVAQMTARWFGALLLLAYAWFVFSSFNAG